MAGAKSGVHVVQLKQIRVPANLSHGGKFIKWDDDSTAAVPVTLRVDPNGYMLYWKDQNKEMDCLDIILIRDVRTGKYARLPKDQKLREAVTMGSDCPLENKVVTVVYGTDLINLNFLNFAAHSDEVAREWTDALFGFATNLLAQNACPLTYLEKAYTKLSTLTVDGKIPVKNIVRMFGQHKDDKKKIEKAMEASRLPSGKNENLNPNKLTFEDFLGFYRHLCARQEVEDIFHRLGAKKKPYLTAEQFRDFLNSEQRDPRLNEILYPYTDTAKAQALIHQFEPNHNLAQKGHMSKDGFLRYLLSEENALIPPEKIDISQDMDQPLSHYFINSSHNTYLTGHQLTGRSSVEIYRQALLTGCRCIELDCWDGKGADEEPVITHGYTMCTDVPFKEVIEAIAESAFKVSDYPVILSFENHCSPKQQVKMAAHCRSILGDMLLTDPLETNPLEVAVKLPGPDQLVGKILVKNKKRHSHRPKRQPKQVAKFGTEIEITTDLNTETAKSENVTKSVASVETCAAGEVVETCKSVEDTENTKVAEESENVNVKPTVAGVLEEGDLSDDSESDSEDEREEGLTEEEENLRMTEKKEKGTAGHEAEAGMEMSALVNYIQPVHFHSFEHAEKRNRSYECVSFVETQASSLLKECPVEFVNYNKRQLSRIYPKGTRVDSSNYMPQIFWNAGCQLVALNFQTLDLAMQLNMGIFEYNGRSGYILKPDFMRRSDRQFDPFAESTVDGIVAGSVQIKVISGQFLSDKKVGTYVEVEMYGLPADTVRKKFKTRCVPGNGINPVYGDEPFKFKKVVLPTLATLRIVVYDENSKMLGHRVLPVVGLRPGYRHICLRNELNQPLPLATLFVHIKVGDFVPDAFADFAEALSNPIAYQSKLEKHAQQLAVLEEDFEVENELDAEEMVKDCRVGSRGGSVISRSSAHASSFHSTDGRPHMRAHAVLSKQDSDKSGMSQGSQGSGTPVGRTLSAAAAENGASGQSSPLHGSKCPSNTNSPQHSNNNRPASGEIGSPKPVSPSIHVVAPTPAAPKIDVLASSTLKDPDYVGMVTLENLKQAKGYQKCVAKLEKELDSLRKKHERARQNLVELHELQEEKLLVSQVKNKASLQKSHSKSIKRASRNTRYGKPEDITQRNTQELSALVSDQETKHRNLKQEQICAMATLCKEQQNQELELQLKLLPQSYEALVLQVEASVECHMRKWEEIHDREVLELKKKLDAQNREEMKSLTKKSKDKSELDRLKREARSKHITLAVQERQKLQDMLDKRKAEVVERHDQLKGEAQEESKTQEESLRSKYSQACSQIDVEKNAVLDSMHHHVGNGESLQSSEQSCESASVNESSGYDESMEVTRL